MPPSIDDHAPLDPSQSRGTVDGRDGTTTVAITAEEAAKIERRRQKQDSIDNLPVMMEGLSQLVFGVPKLRREQKAAILRCAVPQFNDSKLLLVTRTGSGKSHVTRTLGVMMKGIIIIFVPLLSLSADQMKKMEEAKECFGSVETHHLDELPTDDGGVALQRVVARMKQLDETTKSTIFLFASPQFLCTKSSKPLLDELLSSHERKILRVVAVDEAHLHVQHSSFRVQIIMLRELFFKKIFDKENPKSDPVFLAMTATMPSQYIPRLMNLTNVELSDDRRIYRGDQEHFSQRNINFEYKVRESYSSDLDELVKVIANTESDDRVVVLTTLAAIAIALEKSLKDKLNKAGLDGVDVVLVHGDQDKVVKFDGMLNFCGKKDFETFNPRALVTNGAGNTGIDSDKVTEILRAGVMMDLPTALQERGRLVRKDGMVGSITIVFNLKSLLQCLYLLHGLNTKADGATTSAAADENIGFGSTIRHSALLSKEEKNTNKNDPYKQLEEKCKKEIVDEKKSREEEKRKMLLEVLQFFCLNFGCLHARSEKYLATGELGKLDGHHSCNSKCSVCNNNWQKLHRKVNKRALISWFGSDDFIRYVPISTEKDKPSLTDLLWNGNEKWIRNIFKVKKSTLNKYNAECLMLSLIATGIITWEVNSGKIEWCLGKIVDEEGLEDKCNHDAFWDGIPTC